MPSLLLLKKWNMTIFVKYIIWLIVTLLLNGGGGSKTLRLHYYYANKNEVKFLKDKGIETLLSADDDRISYSLPFHYNQRLINRGSLKYDGMNYERTDVRVEKDDLLLKLWTHRNDDELVVFTHEWALNTSKCNWMKFLTLVTILKLLNCKFIID